VKDYLVAAVFALLTYAAGFVCGAVVMSWHYKAEISEFKANAEAQYAQALEAKAVREKYLQGKADENAVKAKEAQDEIEARYKSLLADAADALSVHADSAGGKDSVPSDPKPADRVSTGAGERHAAYRAKLQRLYERQLEIARDCDITASYYNRLIQLWNEAAR